VIASRILQASVLACLVTLPTAAQELGTIRDMDSNGDGNITRAEAQAVMEAKFKAMDTNHDGKLSQEEYVNAGLARLFALDTDHDGTVSRSELRSAFRGRLGR